MARKPDDKPRRGRPEAGTISTGRKMMRVVTVPDVMPEELFDTDAPALNASVPLNDLLAAINAEGVDGKVIVERLVRGAPDEWLFEGAPSGDLNQTLQVDYGPGRYRVRVYARDDSGLLAIRANKTITIGALPKSKEGAMVAQASAPATDRVAELIAEMRAANERASERQMQFMTEMVKALATGNAGKGSTMAEFKDFAAGLGALPKPPIQKDPLELLGVLWGLIEKMRGGSSAAVPVGEDGEVPPSTLFLEGIRTVRELVTNARGQPAANNADVAQLPSPLAPGALPVSGARGPDWQHAAPVVQPPASQTAQEREMLMLKLYVQNLIEHARAASPVDQFSGQVYSLLTDEAVLMLQGETWFDALCAITPVPVELKPWFARLRDQVLELIAEDAADDNAPADDLKIDGGVPVKAGGNGGGTTAAATKRVR